MSTRPTRTRLGFNAHVTVDGPPAAGRKLYTWSVLGKLGAVVLQAREIPETSRSLFDAHFKLPDGTWVFPTDIGRHTAQAVETWDSARTDGCTFLEGVPCFYDGSTLQAEYVFRAWEGAGYDLEHLQAQLTSYYRVWILREEDA